MLFHTNLPVSDIAETIAFYRLLFATEPTKEKPDYAKFTPGTPALNLCFHHDPQAVGKLSGLHLGLQVDDLATLAQMHARLSAAGVVVKSRQEGICCYAKQDKFWVRDPSGYQWEIYVLIEDSERRQYDLGCCPTADDEAQAACC